MISSSSSSATGAPISEALPEITEDTSGTTRVAVLNFSIEKSGEIIAGSHSIRTDMP